MLNERQYDTIFSKILPTNKTIDDKMFIDALFFALHYINKSDGETTRELESKQTNNAHPCNCNMLIIKNNNFGYRTEVHRPSSNWKMTITNTRRGKCQFLHLFWNNFVQDRSNCMCEKSYRQMWKWIEKILLYVMLIMYADQKLATIQGVHILKIWTFRVNWMAQGKSQLSAIFKFTENWKT